MVGVVRIQKKENKGMISLSSSNYRDTRQSHDWPDEPPLHRQATQYNRAGRDG